MTRWDLLQKAKEVLEGKYGNGPSRRYILGKDYEAVQEVVDVIIKNEDRINKEIEKRKEEIRKLEEQLAQEELNEKYKDKVNQE